MKDKEQGQPPDDISPGSPTPVPAGAFDPEGRAQKDLYFGTHDPEFVQMMQNVRRILEAKGLTVLARGMTERDPEKVGGFVPCLTAEGCGDFYLVECVTGRMLENPHLAIRLAIFSRQENIIRWLVVPPRHLEDASELMRWIGRGWKLVPSEV